MLPLFFSLALFLLLKVFTIIISISIIIFAFTGLYKTRADITIGRDYCFS